MAPAHGEDDFALCKANGIDVPETVADDGTYFPWVPLFPGVHVFKAAKPVCDALIAAGALVKQGTVTHSYPHSWRSKAPLIFRATPQWFIRMDGPEHIRDQALTAIANTAFVPEAGRTRLSSMVANRPDWCISRQRAWGVPIAIFTNKRTGEILRDPDVFARTIEAFRTEGADAWYASPPARFLGNTYDANDYEQVHDIVDVWFESGCTNVFTLLNRNLPWPADLYLEGSDQHRGWFQSSLLEGIGARGQAPFKAILTHGFTLDEQGRKMSKSIGNTMAPQKITDEYGADILRLWVMNTDITEDQRIGKEILKQQAELYRRLRNTLRWLLGSLQGWSEQERVSPADMPLLERYILDRLAQLGQRIDTAVQNHDWAGVYPDIHTFCSADLSAFYFDIRKDTLYCDRPDNHTRRACRTMLDLLHRCLCTWLAPVLCFTAEEAWSARFGDSSSVHLQRFPDVSTTAGDASDIKLRVDTIRRTPKRHHHGRRKMPPIRRDRLIASGRRHHPRRVGSHRCGRAGLKSQSSPPSNSPPKQTPSPHPPPPAPNAPAAGASSPKSAPSTPTQPSACAARMPWTISTPRKPPHDPTRPNPLRHHPRRPRPRRGPG